tara:strand:+ start:172 stop:429 length:258 start_codon:yes stop_codon:yes gene_type:complete
MELEKDVLNSINTTFKSKGLQPPRAWFEHGTLWADTENPMAVKFIKGAIEDVVVPVTGDPDNFSVSVNKFEATRREPWTHWAFDF